MRRAQSKLQIGQRQSIWCRNEEMERKTQLKAVLNLKWVAPPSTVNVTIFSLTQLFIYYGYATCFGLRLDFHQATG